MFREFLVENVIQTATDDFEQCGMFSLHTHNQIIFIIGEKLRQSKATAQMCVQQGKNLFISTKIQTCGHPNCFNKLTDFIRKTGIILFVKKEIPPFIKMQDVYHVRQIHDFRKINSKIW